jgi:hypothetical protein
MAPSEQLVARDSSITHQQMIFPDSSITNIKHISPSFQAPPKLKQVLLFSIWPLLPQISIQRQIRKCDQSKPDRRESQIKI